MVMTIEAIVQEGINSLPKLHEALKLAMRLEFATIPPYLCAQWSIAQDPDRVEGTLHSIVGQEMQHLALAGNVLTAIGGRPDVTAPDFLSRYPTSVLPGGIELAVPLELRPLTSAQLAVFMDIEEPEYPPVALLESGAPSIGAFYDTIISAIRTLVPAIDPNAGRLPGGRDDRIKNIDDATNALDRIKQEGEGLQTSPEQPATERERFAHYYRFKEIAKGRRLTIASGTWAFDGAAITFPDVHPFTRESLPSEQNSLFRQALSEILRGLDACWTNGTPFDVAAMFRLEVLGRSLIRAGITPEFRPDH